MLNNVRAVYVDVKRVRSSIKFKMVSTGLRKINRKDTYSVFEVRNFISHLIIFRSWRFPAKPNFKIFFPTAYLV